MTPKAANRPEREVELPEPLERLEHKIGLEEDRLDRLQELGAQIDTVYDEAKRLEQEGRELVAEEIPKVRHDLGGSRSIDELEEIADRITNIVADPYRRAVRQARDDVCVALGIEDEFEDLTVQELNQILEDRSSDQLRNDRDVFDSAETRLSQISENAIDVIAGHIHEEPIRILGSPREAFQKLINQHIEQHDALEELDDEIDELIWTPDATLVETKSLYPDDGTKVDVETVTEYIGNIETIVESMPDGLPLETAIRRQLEAVLPEAEPRELTEEFEAISKSVTDCADHKTEFKLTIRLVDDKDVQVEQIRELDDHLKELGSPLDDDGLLGRDDPVDFLVTHLEELSRKYGRWAEHYHQVLYRDAVAIEAIQSHIDGVPEFKPKKGSLMVTGCPDVDAVYENPLQAIRAHDAYKGWVDALKTEGTGDHSQGESTDVDLLINLVRGNKVPSGRVEPGDFEVLAELLGDGLRLQFAGAHLSEEL